MKFSVTGFFSKCDQIRRKPWIWSHLLNKSLMENFIFCAVKREDKRQVKIALSLAQTMDKSKEK